jgi:hypothetical protein
VAYSQSGQSPKVQIYGMMVLFRSGILCWCWKNPWTHGWIWNLYAPWVQWPWSGQSPKIQVSHDGALSIRKLILNKAQLIMSLFVIWRTTKKCAPYFRGNTEFPIYLKMCSKNSSLALSKDSKYQNSEFEVHQVGPKYAGSQNFSFLALKRAVASVQRAISP